MTEEEEAIKDITENIKPIVGGKSLDIAIESLKKQIAWCVDYEADGYADGQLCYDTWICPRCEMKYEVDYDNYNYCPNCGQKLDYESEVNNEQES